MALMPKKEDFYGDFVKGPLKYAPNAGRSATFTTAQANQNNIKNVAFLYDRASDYAIARIKNEAILASKNNSGAFISILKQEMEGAQQNIANSAAAAIYGTGSGAIGQIPAGQNVALTTVTLSDPETIVNFEVGYTVSASAANGGGSVKAGSLVVASVDRVNGVVTFTQALSTGIATIAASDFLFIQGDYDLKMKGLGAWIPSTTPGATPFFGVDRSLDVTRLGGWRGDLSALPIEEALIQGGMKIQRDGGKVDHVFHVIL